MRTTRIVPSVVLTLASVLLLLASCAQQAGTRSLDRADAAGGAKSHRAPLRDAVTTTVADVPIPDLPGKRLVSRVIDYPPGSGLPAHRHARSAFIYAHVLSGEIRSKVDDEPPRIYRAGEVWFEKPGVHHQVSANASDTEPARLLAVLIVDAAEEQLTIPDTH